MDKERESEGAPKVCGSRGRSGLVVPGERGCGRCTGMYTADPAFLWHWAGFLAITGGIESLIHTARAEEPPELRARTVQIWKAMEEVVYLLLSINPP